MNISSQGGDWLKFSKKPTSCALASPSRKDAFQFRLPQTKFPRNANGEVVVSSITRASTDPFGLKNIPPLSLLEKWKNELSFFAKEAKGYYYLELGSQCFTMSNIQDMIKMHHARDLQKAVQVELNWFADPYLKPSNVHMYPAEDSIKTFQELLYTRPFDDLLPGYGITPNELAKLCGARWISSDHLLWMAETLNKEQSHTFCSVINPIIDVESLAARKLQPLQPNSLLFFVNVSSVAGRRVLATDVQRGCHWTLCQVNNVNKTIIYADTLGWQIPEGLMDKVNRFVTGVYSDDTGQLATNK